MKTAMQLMLEDLELKYKVLSDAQIIQGCAAIEGSIDYAKSLIIKEKEQIIDAVNNNEKKAVDFCNKAVFEYWQHERLFDIEKNAGLNYFNEKFDL